MDLEFDKMTMDITLAQDYLKSEKKLINLKYQPSDHLSPQYNYSKLVDVAEKIKENTNLLAQLEYLQRNVPVEDTIIQIKLIVQHIHYFARQLQDPKKTTGSLCTIENGLILIFYLGVFGLSQSIQLVFGETLLPSKDFLTTLAMLVIFYKSLLIAGTRVVKIIGDNHLFNIAAIPKAVALNNLVFIHADETTEAICYLITNLYQDAGFPVVATLSAKDYPDTAVQINIPVGTIGVISENSDIDSAVDVFLTSSSQVPWKLLKILVQESAYQQFKNALVWKCNLNTQKVNASDASPYVLKYNGRAFLMDMTAFTESQSSEVTIEAYRTRKELKSLLNVYQTHYLSLWANDIAEINEIAYSASSSVVWVNNYGDFRGPSKVSEIVCSYTVSTQIPKVHGIYELKKSWQALDFETRRNVLCKVFDEFDDDKDNVYKKIQKDLRTTECGTNGSFVDVGNDYVCTGLPIPSNKIFVVKNVDIFTTEFFEAVLKGNAFIALPNSNEKDINIKNIFQKFRIPVVYYTDLLTYEYMFWHPYQPFDVTQNTKIIWTNSGTIFAN